MRKMRMFLIGIALVLLSTPHFVSAQTLPPPPRPVLPPQLSYSANFVCGTTEENTEAGTVKGVYLTGINIYNPQPYTVNFSKNVVISYPEGVSRGPISKIIFESLESGRSLEVTCQNIRNLFESTLSLPRQIQGFVVIRVTPDTAELDVWGKYTSRHRVGTGAPMDSDVESINLVEVHPKHITFPILPPGF